MKNTVPDLINHLFEQLERINDDELTEKELDKEVERGRAMVSISSQLVKAYRLELDACRFVNDGGYGSEEEVLPKNLICGEQKKLVHKNA